MRRNDETVGGERIALPSSRPHHTNLPASLVGGLYFPEANDSTDSLNSATGTTDPSDGHPESESIINQMRGGADNGGVTSTIYEDRKCGSGS